MLTASYYQAQLDSINVAISALETGELETVLSDGRKVRNHQLDWLYAERARLERELTRAGRPGGRISISRGAPL